MFRLSIQSLIYPFRIICLQRIGCDLKYLLLQLSLALALQLLFLFSLELSINLCALGRFVAVSASLVAVSFLLFFWRLSQISIGLTGRVGSFFDWAVSRSSSGSDRCCFALVYSGYPSAAAQLTSSAARRLAMDRSSSAILLEYFLIFNPRNTYWNQGCCESSPCPRCRGSQRCAPTQERFSDRQPRRHHGYQRWSSQTWWMCIEMCVLSGWKGELCEEMRGWMMYEKKFQSISRPFCSSSSTMNQCHGRTSSPQPWLHRIRHDKRKSLLTTTKRIRSQHIRHK